MSVTLRSTIDVVSYSWESVMESFTNINKTIDSNTNSGEAIAQSQPIKQPRIRNESSVFLDELNFNESDIFARRDSISRSPPNAKVTPRLVDPFSAGTSTPSCGTPQSSYKKRKAADSPVTEQTVHETPKVLTKLKAKSEELLCFCNNTKNVHQQIKKWSQEIKSLTNGTVDTYFTKTLEMNNLREEFEKYKQLQNKKIEELQSKIKHLTTINSQNPSFSVKENPNPIDITKCNIQSYDDFANLATQEWTANSYANITVDHNDPIQHTAKNKLFFCSANSDMPTKMDRRIRNLYSDIDEADRIECTGGSMIILDQSNIIHSKEGPKTNNYKIIIGYYNPSKQDGRTKEDIFNLAKHMASVIKETGLKEIAMMHPAGIELEFFQKITSATYNNTNVKVTIIGARKNKEKKNINTRHKTKMEQLFIKSGKNSYSDIVKQIKETLKTDELTNINTIQKSREGGVIIKVNKDAIKLKQEMTKVLKDVRITDNTYLSKKVINIRGLDCLTTRSEVETAILETNDIKNPDTCVFKNLRPTERGNQIATVVVSKEDGLRLLKRRSIRIGLTNCSISERITVKQCFKCWNFNHSTRECKEEVDRRQLCMKCCETGHKATECTGNSFCPICNLPGHEVGSNKCKSFKDALTKATSERKAKEKDQLTSDENIANQH